MLDPLLTEYPELARLATAMEAAGHTLYLVGGPVRDLLSNLVPKDLDVTSAARPAEFRAVADTITGASVYDVGETHGTTGIAFARPDGTTIVVEHTTHRTEVYEPGSRTPTVAFGDSLIDDLARRDFTINAIAMDLRTGELTDPHNGVDDLTAKLLRTPDDAIRTFSEDPLRIVRLVRFAALRGLEIDVATGEAATVVADRLAIVSIERITAELRRIFDKGPIVTSTALKTCDRLRITREVFGPLGAKLNSSDDLLHGGFLPGDVLAILAMTADEDPEKTLRKRTFTLEDIKPAMATLKALTALSTVLQPGLENRNAAYRSVLRTFGFDAAVRAGRLAKLAVATGFVAPFEAGDSLAAGLAMFRDDEKTPLPVNGNDALEAGLKGRAVGAALAKVESAFCVDPALSRDQALALLAS